MSWLVSFLFRFFNSTVIKFFIIVCWKFCIEESWWQVASGHYWKRTSWWQCDDFFHRHWETWVCLSFSSTQCTIFIDKLASSGSFGKIAQQVQEVRKIQNSSNQFTLVMTSVTQGYAGRAGNVEFCIEGTLLKDSESPAYSTSEWLMLLIWVMFSYIFLCIGLL